MFHTPGAVVGTAMVLVGYVVVDRFILPSYLTDLMAKVMQRPLYLHDVLAVLGDRIGDTFPFPLTVHDTQDNPVYGSDQGYHHS